MHDDIIDRLQDLCAKLREKLMLDSDYRALLTLERTIQELSGCRETIDSLAGQGAVKTEDTRAPEVDMQHGAEHLAGRLADALRDRKSSAAASYLPSHRVA